MALGNVSRTDTTATHVIAIHFASVLLRILPRVHDGILVEDKGVKHGRSAFP